MRKSILLVCALLPIYALANVQRPGLPRRAEFLLMSYGGGGAMSASANLSGAVVGAEPIEITRVSFTVISNSGGGAGSTVVRVTDGTNLCTATLACSVSSSGSPKSVAAEVAGAGGTGCLFAPGATLYASVTTAGCTTTQPTVRTINFMAERR